MSIIAKQFSAVCKTSPRLAAALVLSAGLLCADSVRANVSKANNTTLLNNPASWVGGATPGSSDVAQWDGTVTAANTVGLGASTNWAGIAITSPGGAVTITNDGNTLTLGASGIDLSAANNNLTVYAPVALGAAQTWNVLTSRTLTVSNVISEASAGTGLTKSGAGTVNLYGTNTYTGPTVVNGGTLTLTSGSLAAGSSLKINTGGSLSLFSSATINGQVEVGTNTTAAQNASVSGKIVGNLTIDAGATPASPNANATATVATGWVQANLAASISAGGYITNNGTLVLSGTGIQTIGTIVGSGSMGGVQDNNTAAKTINFASGNALSYFQPGNGAIDTLQLSPLNGSIYIKFFGYNDAATAGFGYTNLINGGTWTLGSVGQNNSSCHYVGVCTISNSAAVTITNNNGYVHGAWIVVSNSSLTFNQAATPLTAAHAANNFGLNLSASNSGSIFAVGNGVNLAFGQSTPNSVAETNSITIGSGGLVVITNGSSQNLTLGNSGKNFALETDIVNLSGGKLIVAGTLAASGTVQPGSYWTNATSYTPVPTTNIFNWTGGQLTARSITVSNGVVVDVVTNASPFSAFVTNPAVMGGNFSGIALTNNAGTLAPGDVGTGGKTTINGSYVQTAGGTLDIDIDGTAQAGTFQTANSYDYVLITNAAVLGGNLLVRTNGSFALASTSAFTILSAVNISGTFANLTGTPAGDYLGTVTDAGSDGTFDVYTNSAGTTLYLTNYQAAVTSVSTTTTVASSANPSTYGQSVTFTATIAPQSGSTVPTGAVQFKTNGVALGSPVTVSTGASPDGTAVSPAVGSLTVAGSPYVVTAEFTATGSFLNSTGTLSGGQSVNKATPTLTLQATGIIAGQTLAASSLAASAATNANNGVSVAGGFAFADSTILAPLAGATNVTVNFTPSDTADYNANSGIVPVQVSVPATATNLTRSVSGGVLTLSWPANYTGWILQSNAVSLTSSGSWFTVPNSTNVNSVGITLDPTQPKVFYRMLRPY